MESRLHSPRPSERGVFRQRSGRDDEALKESHMTLYPLSYGPLPVRRDLNPRHSRWMEFLRHSSRPDSSPNRSEGRVKVRDRRSPKEWSPVPHSLRPVRAALVAKIGHVPPANVRSN